MIYDGIITKPPIDELYHDSLQHYGVKGMKWGVRKQKAKYLKNIHKDMKKHFRNQISKNASKVTALGKNGYDNRGSAWNKAYRKGKVTSKDDKDIKKAAKNTRQYAIEKYGEDAIKELSSSGVFYRTKRDKKSKQKDLYNLKKEYADYYNRTRNYGIYPDDSDERNKMKKEGRSKDQAFENHINYYADKYGLDVLDVLSDIQKDHDNKRRRR